MKRYKVSIEVPKLEQHIFYRNLKDDTLIKNKLADTLIGDGNFFDEFNVVLTNTFGTSLTRKEAKKLFYMANYGATKETIELTIKNKEKALNFMQWYKRVFKDFDEFIKERKKIIEFKRAVWRIFPETFTSKGAVNKLTLDCYEIQAEVLTSERDTHKRLKGIIKQLKETMLNCFHAAKLEPVPLNVKVEEINHPYL